MRTSMPIPSDARERCYIPSKETTRQLYVQRQNLRNKSGKKLRTVPENSVPWSAPPRSIAEALAISDEIRRLGDALRDSLFPT